MEHQRFWSWQANWNQQAYTGFKLFLQLHLSRQLVKIDASLAHKIGRETVGLLDKVNKKRPCLLTQGISKLSFSSKAISVY